MQTSRESVDNEVDDEEYYEDEEEEYEEEDEEYEEDDGGAGETELTADSADSASWNTRIQQAQSSTEFGRSTTPLRPDDGLVARVNRGRIAGMAALGASTMKNKVAKSRQEKHAKQVAAIKQAQSITRMFPEINSARSFKGQIPEGEDPYSLHEKDLVSELNLCRANPSQYAVLMSSVVLVGEPFVPPAQGKVTFQQLKDYHARIEADHRELGESLRTLEESEQKEISILKDQWAIEDAEKAKKSKKAPAAKKSKTGEAVVDEAALAAQALEQERAAAITAITSKNDDSRQRYVKGIKNLGELKDKANTGISTLQQCFAKLGSIPTMAPVRYNRGLSLAARDLAGNTKLVAELDSVCARYGTLNSEAIPVFHTGTTPVRQTVMEMLLCLSDPKRKGRARMLDPQAAFVGAGWRRDMASNGESISCLLFSPDFEELEAVAIREHMSLQDVRRILAEAKELSSKTMLTLKSPQARMVSPKAHPVVCSNTATVSLECPGSMIISGTLFNEREPVPKAPGLFAGEVFTQRNGPQVDIHVIIPFKSRFCLAIFASDDASQSGFRNIGIVKLHAEEWHMTNRGVTAPFAYPIASNNFIERQSFLVSPMEGALKPGQQYTFEVVVPRTNYLAHEVERINANLAEATKVSSGSKEQADALRQKKTEAELALQEAVTAKDEKAPQLQQEISALIKEQAKKRGKELEKNKTALAEVEQQLKALESSVSVAQDAAREAEEKILLHRRSTRQASAQRRRYLSEQAQVTAATDRSKPVDVELSLEERRARLTPIDEDLTRYVATVRAPREGQVCMFIGGIVALTWQVGQ